MTEDEMVGWQGRLNGHGFDSWSGNEIPHAASTEELMLLNCDVEEDS